MNRTNVLSIASISVLAILAGCAAKLTPAVQQDVQAQLDGRKSAYANCYTAALKRSETIKGDMNLTMVVGPDGLFTEVAVASGSVNDDQLKQCVIDATQGVGISGPPPAPIQITYSLNFEAGDVGGKALGEGGEAALGEGGAAEPPPAPPAKTK